MRIYNFNLNAKRYSQLFWLKILMLPALFYGIYSNMLQEKLIFPCYWVKNSILYSGEKDWSLDKKIIDVNLAIIKMERFIKPASLLKTPYYV